MHEYVETQKYSLNYKRHIIFLDICCLGVIVCLILHMILIWNEGRGPDSHKRTLVNMLVSGLSWSIAEFLIFVILIDILRYFYGPLPHELCLVKGIMSGSIILQTLLFLTAIVTTKYIFIFHIKNPTAIDDKYWKVFLTTWIRMFAYLCQMSAFTIASNIYKAI